MAYYTLTSDANPGTLTLQANSPGHAIQRAIVEQGWNDYGTIEVLPYLAGVHEIRPVAKLED